MTGRMAVAVWMVGTFVGLWFGTLLVAGWWLVETSGLGAARFVAVAGLLAGSVFTGLEAWLWGRR